MAQGRGSPGAVYFEYVYPYSEVAYVSGPVGVDGGTACDQAGYTIPPGGFFGFVSLYVCSSPGSVGGDPCSGEHGGQLAEAGPFWVYLGMTVTPPVASAGAVDQGQPSTLLSFALGGARPYAYQWSEEGPGGSGFAPVAGGTSAAYLFATGGSTATGTWRFELTATDGESPAVSSTSSPVSVVVDRAPTVTISPQDPSVDPGQPVALTATPSGGSGAGWSFEWYQGPSCTGPVVARGPSYSPSPAFTATYCVEATDSLGGRGTAATTVNVLLGSVVLSQFTYAPVFVSYPDGVNVSWSGGTGDYGVTLYRTATSPCTPAGAVVASASGVASRSKTLAFVAPSSTGTYYYCAAVTGSGGGTASSQRDGSPLAVEPAPTAQAFSAPGGTQDPPSFAVGQTVYGAIVTYPSGANIPVKLEYVDPSSNVVDTTPLVMGTYADSIGYTVPATETAGNWTLRVVDGSGSTLSSAPFAVTMQAAPDLPAGAVFLFIPVAVLYMAARRRGKNEQG